MANLEIDEYMKKIITRCRCFEWQTQLRLSAFEDLVELVLGIDYKQSSQNYNKNFSTIQYKIPDEIFKRNKKGFELPYIN